VFWGRVTNSGVYQVVEFRFREEGGPGLVTEVRLAAASCAAHKSGRNKLGRPRPARPPAPARPPGAHPRLSALKPAVPAHATDSNDSRLSMRAAHTAPSVSTIPRALPAGRPTRSALREKVRPSKRASPMSAGRGGGLGGRVG